MPVTTIVVRLDERTRAGLARVARRRHETLSEATRRAIALLVEQDQKAQDSNPYLLIADLLGRVAGPEPRKRRKPRRKKRGREDRGRP
jgi:hypothetical protein